MNDFYMRESCEEYSVIAEGKNEVFHALKLGMKEYLPEGTESGIFRVESDDEIFHRIHIRRQYIRDMC